MIPAATDGGAESEGGGTLPTSTGMASSLGFLSMRTNVFDNGTESTWADVSLVDTPRDHQSPHQQAWDSSLISPWQRLSLFRRDTFHVTRASLLPVRGDNALELRLLSWVTSTTARSVPAQAGICRELSHRVDQSLITCVLSSVSPLPAWIVSTCAVVGALYQF